MVKYGNNIALNAESYKVEDSKLLNVLSLKIAGNIDNLENEKLTNNLGETFETIEEYLQLTYGLEDLEPNDKIIISFAKQNSINTMKGLDIETKKS